MTGFGKTLCAIVLMAGAAAGIAGCTPTPAAGSYLPNSTLPLRDEGVYVQVDASYNRGDCIASADWDEDGDLDILSSDGYGLVFLYENLGSGVFTKAESPLFEVPSGYNRGCSLDLADIDADGDLDVLSSDGYGEVHLYRNMSE